jgi:RNA polymerase sigma-70 factor (ECF subfamily)
MDDSALIKDCLSGNVRAQKTLFDRFAPKMLGVCMRYCKSKEQAEDVLQDGFEGWIRKIMVNTSLDSLRKEMKISADVDLESAGDQSESEKVLAELTAAEIVELITSMPDGYRVVFNLFAIEGYSHQEIADTLGITESTSKSQYSRARAYLRKKLEKEEIGR